MSKAIEQTKLADLISTGEAAKILSITIQHASYLARIGELDGQKIANRWFVTRESVYAYLRNRDN